jgi:hypothetical protein
VGITQFAAGQRVTAQQLNSLPVVVSYLATGSGGASSTSEVIVGTFTIPANDPSSPGGYWFWVNGTMTQAGTPTLTMRVRLNSTSGTALAGAANVTNTTPGIFQIDCKIGMEAIGSSGSFGSFVNIWANYGGSVQNPFLFDAVALNTTISNTLVVTAQFNASNSGNLATTKFGALYRL